MRRIVFASAAAVAFASPAAAAKFTMQLIASPGQVSRMESGVAAIDSSQAASSVRLIQAEGNLKKRGTFQLLLMNQGQSPFTFGPENVTAALAEGTPVEIITYERLAKEEKRRQMWAGIAAGLAAAGNSMSAANSGYYSGTATYSGSTFGTFGSTPFNSRTTGTAMISGYSSGQVQIAQQLANQQNQAQFARMAENNASRMSALKAYMRTTTVDPQQMFGGTVMFELPKSVHKMKGDVPMRFIVTVNGEQHTFESVLKRN